MDISSVLASRESSSVGFTDGGDGDDFRAVDQGVGVVAEDCHLGHHTEGDLYTLARGCPGPVSVVSTLIL